MNGVLWFVLVIIPWIGIFSLLVYLIIRETRENVKKDKRVAKAILDEDMRRAR
jgi:preprotein translocase subunit YajC